MSNKTITFPKPSEEILKRLRMFEGDEQNFEKLVSGLIKEASLRIEAEFTLTVLDQKFIDQLYRKYGKHGYADSEVFKMKDTELITEIFKYAAKRNELHSKSIEAIFPNKKDIISVKEKLTAQFFLLRTFFEKGCRILNDNQVNNLQKAIGKSPKLMNRHRELLKVEYKHNGKKLSVEAYNKDLNLLLTHFANTQNTKALTSVKNELAQLKETYSNWL